MKTIALVFAAGAAAAAAAAQPKPAVTHAIAVLIPGKDSKVAGTIHFKKEGTGVHVTGTTWNLAVHDMSEAAAHIRSLVYETLTTTRGSPTTEWVQFELEMVLAGDAWKVDDVKANILEPSTGPSPTG